MNYIIWNARGTGSKSFSSLVREIKNHYQVDFMDILETRADREKSEHRIKNMGFQEYGFTAAKGFSGGIWCLWNNGVCKIRIIESHHQYIHLCVESNRQDKWYLTVLDCGLCKSKCRE